MTIRIGINGFGSIGRRVFRIAMQNPQVKVVAINDLGDPATMAHLLKYDSTYGILPVEVQSLNGKLVVDGKETNAYTEKDPALIPWGENNVDVVIESTGVFNDGKKAAAHLKGGAKKVIISAPSKNHDLMIVMGVNQEKYDPTKHHVISNASCTTNCLAPMAKVLDQNFGLISGLMNTIHSYTNDQRILDLPHKDLRRARPAAQAIIPTTTGAAKAVGEVLPHLKGKLNGMAMRVPTPAVSVVDLTVLLRQKPSAEEINAAFREAAGSYLSGILTVCDTPLVSLDFKGMTHSVAVDSLSTVGIDELVKVIGWYDNEWGYACRIVDLVEHVAN